MNAVMRVVISILALGPLCFARADSEGPIRVGVIVPLSGDFAVYGQSVVRAMQLANSSRQGAKLKFVIEDNKTCESSEAVSAFQKLVTVDGIRAVVTFCTAAAQSVLPLAKARKLPLIQLSESGPDSDNYMIKMMPESTPFVDLLASTLVEKYRTIAIVGNITEVNSGVRGNVPLFTKVYEGLGGKVVLSELFPDSDTDFRTLLLKIRASGAKGVIPFIWSPRQMAAFLKQAEEMKLWRDSALAGNFVFELMWNQLLEAYPPVSRFEGLESVNFKVETSAEFLSQYRAAYNEAPAQFADYAFDAADMIKRCGLDTNCLTRRREGVSGSLEFGADRRRVGRFVNKELRQGSWNVVESDTVRSE